MTGETETLMLAIDAGRVRKGGKDFEDAGRTIERTGRRIDRSVDRTEAKVRRLGRSTATASGLMTRFLTGAALIAGARGAVRVFADYEQSIATIRGVLSGQIKDQDLLNQSMIKISGTARELGATTRFSASEAATGLLELTRAGFSTAESTKTIAATLNLAQTGAIELGQASEITAGLVRGFGVDAAESGRIVDVLVAQSSRAKTGVADLGMTIQKFGPIAKAMGIGFEEAAAAAGVLADAGTPAETAGINMRQVLLKLIKPTGEAKKAILDMGLSLQDVNPEAHSLVDIFEKLAAGGLDASKAASIFMSRNTSAALILSENTEKMKAFIEANKNASSEAAIFAAIMDDTLIGSFKSLISAVQEGVLQFGEGKSGFGSALRTVMDTMTGAVRILVGMEDSVTKNRKAAFLLAKALQGVGIAAEVLVGLKLLTLTSSLLVSLTQIPTVLAKISASLVPLAATLAGVLTAALSFELGRFFYDEFKSVQVTLAGFIKFLDQSWSQVKAAWKLLMVDMLELLSTNFVSGAVDIISDFAVSVASIFDVIFPGFSDNLDSMLIGTTAALKASANFTDAMRKDILTELDSDMKFAELVMGNSLDAIENEFNGRTRKGNNFADFIKGDMATAKTEILAFIDDLAARAEDSFTKATSGETGMGPFIPADIAAQRAAVADMAALMGMLADETDNLSDSTTKSAEKYEEWVKELEEARTSMLIEIALLEGVTDKQRILLEAKQRGIDLSNEQLDLLARMEEELVVLDRQREKAEDLKNLYDDIGDSVASSFEDVIFGAKSAEDAIEDMVRQITQMIFNMLVTQQIANAISGGLSAAFGVGSGSSGAGGGGGTTTRERGGVHSGLRTAGTGMLLNSPTRLRDSGGSNILAREMGPEAIVPLGTDSQGNLGIRNLGGGGGGGTTNVYMQVVTKDKRSFESRESQQQIQRRLQRTLQQKNRTPG